MVESRPLLYSVLAGLIAGIISSATYIALVPVDSIERLIEEMVNYQVESRSITEEEARSVLSLVSSIRGPLAWLFYVSPVMNMVLLGAILGVLLDALTRKLAIKAGTASLIVGALLVSLQLVFLYSMYDGLLALILARHIGVPLALLPSLLYTALLVVFNSVEGPWSTIASSKPEKY